MSDHHKDGGPAFPSEGEGHGNPMYHGPGMSLRDYFAAKALAAMLEEIYQQCRDSGMQTDVLTAASIASYACADAMLEAREK